MTLEIFWTVRSVMDSVRVSFGDLTAVEISPVDLALVSGCCGGEGGGGCCGPHTVAATAGLALLLLLSSRKLPDFLIFEADWLEALLSLLRAPSSMFRLLQAFSSVFFSSFCPVPPLLLIVPLPLLLLLLPLMLFSEDLLLVKEAKILLVILCAAEVAVLRLVVELAVVGGGDT
jgi:hypothetical protein